VQIVVRAVTLETGGTWVDMCGSSIGDLMHRLRFTPRVAHVVVQRRHEVDLDAEAAFKAEVDPVLCDSGIDRSGVINLDGTAARLRGVRNVTWVKAGADGVCIHSPSNPKDCFTVVAACTADGQKLPLTFVARGKTGVCHKVLVILANLGSHTPRPRGW
jgi:hypothetical protein